MILETILRAVIVLWPASEIVLALFRRASRVSARARDRGSALLVWGAIALGITAGALLQDLDAGRIGLPWLWIGGAALTLILGGLVIRWSAILTLGRFFTVDVAIHGDHRIVREGLYRFVRHPAYTGSLVSFAGLGVALRSWISLLTIVAPFTAAILYRIRVEERALIEAFGSDYLEYSRVTKRLIPGVY